METKAKCRSCTTESVENINVSRFIDKLDAFFKTNIISIETDENKHCKAVPVDNYQVKNTLFDGQALIDTSIFLQNNLS